MQLQLPPSMPSRSGPRKTLCPKAQMICLCNEQNRHRPSSSPHPLHLYLSSLLFERYTRTIIACAPFSISHPHSPSAVRATLKLSLLAHLSIFEDDAQSSPRTRNCSAPAALQLRSATTIPCRSLHSWMFVQSGSSGAAPSTACITTLAKAYSKSSRSLVACAALSGTFLIATFSPVSPAMSVPLHFFKSSISQCGSGDAQPVFSCSP